MQIDLSNITCQLEKKREFIEDTNAIIGTEIRLSRKKLSLTLKAVADETCSVSYVSKVETNSIDPNVQYLEEICDKVNIDKKKFKELKNSIKTINDVIDAMYDNNLDKIKEIYENCKSFENYRHLILHLYYYFTTGDYYKFNKVYKQILPLISTLSEVDLLMYVFIVGYYAYEKGDTLDAVKIFEELDEFNINNKKLLILIYAKYLECLVRLNSNHFHTIKEKLLDLAGRVSNTKYLSLAFKLENEFNNRNLFIDSFFEIYQDMSNTDSNMYKLLKKEAKEGTFYEVVFAHYTDINKFNLLADTYASKNILEEYTIDYLKLKENDIVESINYALDVCLPEAYHRGDLLFITYFKNEVEYYYSSQSKYKRACEVEQYYRRFIKTTNYCY